MTNRVAKALIKIVLLMIKSKLMHDVIWNQEFQIREEIFTDIAELEIAVDFYDGVRDESN